MRRAAPEKKDSSFECLQEAPVKAHVWGWSDSFIPMLSTRFSFFLNVMTTAPYLYQWTSAYQNSNIKSNILCKNFTALSLHFMINASLTYIWSPATDTGEVCHGFVSVLDRRDVLEPGWYRLGSQHSAGWLPSHWSQHSKSYTPAISQCQRYSVRKGTREERKFAFILSKKLGIKFMKELLGSVICRQIWA